MSDRAEIMVEIDGLDKNFGAERAVRDFSLSVARGEFVTLLGPSGCGKTTTLRCIAGLERPDAGEIRIGDEVVASAGRGIYLYPEHRNIGMVFQSYAVWPHMTVFDNVAYGLRVRRTTAAEIKDRTTGALELVGLAHLAERYATKLSGGQRQRVALARAIVYEPRVLLFDEPLSNLDAKLRVDMRAEIKKLHHRLGTTIIYVTHDQIEAMTLGNRIAVMKEGDVVQLGTPKEVYSDPVNRYVAEFIGSPSMNFIPTNVESQEGGLVLRLTPKGQAPVAIPAPDFLNGHEGKEVTLGLRPEQITNLPQWSDAVGVHAIDIEVEVTEPTGPDTLVFTEINGASVISRSHPENVVEDGVAMTLSLSMSQAVFFDPQTGERIR